MTSRAFGTSQVGTGGLVDPNPSGRPLDSRLAFAPTTNYRYYALSGVFTAGAASTAIALSLDPASVAEDAGTATVTVTATLNAGARTTATSVTVSRTGGTAMSGTDYAAVSNFTVTIPANQRSGPATLTFTPTDDSAAESAETVILSASATGLTGDTATLTIIDNDTASTAVALSLDPATVAEGGGAATVTVTATLDGKARTTATAVTVSETADGTATSATDYAAVSNFTVTIPANQTSATATLTFTPTNDSTAEGAETVILSGSATGLTGGTATLTISDDDTASTAIALSLDPASVAEDAGAATVTVTATLNAGARTTATSVTVSRTGGTAMSGTDYAAVSNFTVTIPANQRSGTATLTFTPMDDSASEDPETVILSASATGLTGYAASLRIIDDDIPVVTVSFGQGTYSALEGTDVRIKVQLSADPEREVIVPLTTAHQGGATSADYSEVPESVTFQRGDTEKSITFRATADTVDDDGESVKLGFGTLPAKVTAGTTNELTVSIITNDVLVKNTGQEMGSGLYLETYFPSAAQAFTTGSDAHGFTLSSVVIRFIHFDNPTTAQLRVTLNADNSGIPDSTLCTLSNPESFSGSGGLHAFNAPATGTDMCPALASSTTYLVVLTRVGNFNDLDTIRYDATDSGDEDSGGRAGWSLADGTVSLKASSDSWSTDSQAMGIQVRGRVNPDSPTFALSLDLATVAEGGGAATITVTATLDGPALTTATAVTVSRTGGTARSGTDYAAVSPFTVTIPANQTSGTATLTFTPMEDGTAEGAETVILGASATGLTGGKATLTITDNDTASTAIALSLEPASVAVAPLPVIFLFSELSTDSSLLLLVL